MLTNPVIDTLLSRKSIRKYRTEQPSDEVAETLVRAGQQATFTYKHSSLAIGSPGVHHARLQSATPECR